MLPISVVDFEEDGVRLMPTTDGLFEDRAEAIIGGRAAGLMELRPYLAIVENRDPRTVVAYTVAWTVRGRNDVSETHYTQFKFPDAVAGISNGLAMLEGREIHSGESRLVGVGFEAWPPDYVDTLRDFGRHEIARMGDVKHLGIALDAVIFEDGTLLGQDQSNLAEHFIAYLQAKQVRYREIVVGLENGSVGTDVFAEIRGLVNTRYPPKAHDPLAAYDRQAAAEVLGLHDRVVLEVFRRALRREGFSIKPQ